MWQITAYDDPPGFQWYTLVWYDLYQNQFQHYFEFWVIFAANSYFARSVGPCASGKGVIDGTDTVLYLSHEEFLITYF